MQIDHKIAVIGLGYVGLPLALEFSKKFPVVGYDINDERINELSAGYDRTQEVDAEELQRVLQNAKPRTDYAFAQTGSEPNEEFAPDLFAETGLTFSSRLDDLRDANTYIITVPTPIDHFKKPDLAPLLKASAAVGEVLGAGDIVIYESTVYPGCTEDDCVPVLEQVSRLKFNEDFFCGYSPERINPGDKVNTLTKIRKVTSGSTADIADVVDRLYGSIITAGTHKAPSLKVAEASKAIENAQRDINISFVNELALIFDRIGIDTNDVLEAAGTKWNFLKYRPGLVGGHCIGVDPYYLAHKAESLGYHPQVILSGRRVNDSIGEFIANKVVKILIRKGKQVKNAKALILGITFKENCPDIRNSRVIDIYTELLTFGLDVDVFDPWANTKEVKKEYGINLLNEPTDLYNLIILAVAHSEFNELNMRSLSAVDAVIFDSKAVLERSLIDGRL